MTPLPDPRTTAARALLADQHARLTAALASIEGDRLAICERNLCRRLLGKVEWWQCKPDGAVVDALGFMGPNGSGPAIDDACRQAAFAASFADVRRAA